MSSAKKKVIVSACLLGEYCRYDGKTKEAEGLKQCLEGCEVIPFCPEAPLFGTPRERIDVVEIAGEERILTHETNKDVTELLKKEIENFCSAHPEADEIILKSKSPSCGNGTTPILGENKTVTRYGDGIACKVFKKFYNENILRDENRYLNIYM